MDKIFKNHPNLKAYYKTSDGTAFYTESDAKLHAKTLENKNIEPVFRSIKEKVEKAVDNIHQDKLQNDVAKDIMSVVKTDEEKEAEEKAKQEAEALAQKEAEEKAKQETEASVKKVTPAKAKKVTQPKQK